MFLNQVYGLPRNFVKKIFIISKIYRTEFVLKFE